MQKNFSFKLLRSELGNTVVGRLALIFAHVFLVMGCETGKMAKTEGADNYPITLVIHGGAGAISRKNMTPEGEQEYRMALQHALDTGISVLDKGGRSIEAVIAAITYLEDCPLFNAGKGSVFTYSGRN